MRELTHNNLTILTDFYELTMINGYFSSEYHDKTAYFDMFFRRVPDGGGFAICAGLEQFIEYIENIHFTQSDIDFLRNKKIFSEDFLQYLKDFKFNCDVWAIPEGTPIFPNQPLITVHGPAMQAQFIETMTLLAINHQSLIATKANRIVSAAQGRTVMEFGSRRAHGYDGAIYGARAAYIGGIDGTSCVIADRDFGIPTLGTMAHSWVQMFDDEISAFRAYACKYPDDCTLLVDTFNTLKSGIPNAIKVFNEEIIPRGFRPKAIRIDSGDITFLSKKARKILDDAGFIDCKIMASNSLDEYIIRDMIIQGALVDSFGVGERLITAASDPVFSGVYKLVAVDSDDGIIPKIKLSENITKLTIPGYKCPWRLFDRESGKAIADVITLNDETIDDTQPYEIFDPDHIWKRKAITNFIAKPLQVQIFKNGNSCYKSPSVEEIRNRTKEGVDSLWDEVTRFENPHKYCVYLSQNLWDQRQALLAVSI
ncbi:MAG: nicotinate phosphoribosyltransferase [Clostridiales bacterium 43-6]|nr:MAG: nicotinate phosphoribosyltransferase [Clostridiales bacterium 43-6]